MYCRVPFNEINQLRILRLLRLHPGISRAEIVRQTGLGKATVSTIVAELIAQGIVSETAATARSRGVGRRPVELRLEGTTHLAIGVELTGNECLATLTDMYASPLRFVGYPMPDCSVDTSVMLVARAVEELIRGHDLGRVLGVGVGVPGPVDSDRQRVIQAENLGWTDVPLGGLLSGQLGKPVIVVKRQNAGALGEYWYGAGRGKSSVLYVSVGVGIGSGMIVRGELYEGVSGSAGEIGHITIDPEGHRCKCGNIGCLETLASGPAMAVRARELIKHGRSSCLVDWTKGVLEAITARMVLDAAARGDPLAVEVAQEAAGYLGIALATAVNLLNPSVVVIGGEVLALGELYLAPIRQVVRSRSFSISVRAADIVLSPLGRRAAPIGAATLAIDRFFAMPGIASVGW